METFLSPRLRAAGRVLLVAASLLLGSGAARAAGVYRLELRDTIQPVTADYVIRGITEAERGGARLVVIEIDTPGGLVDSTRAITTRILDAKVPVAVFVAPRGARAASAGFVILISADVAAMAPATNTGAAHPVTIGSGEERRPEKDEKSGPSVMFEKMENDMAAMVRSLAATRGRNVEMAEKGVRESLSFTEKEAIEKKLVDVIAPDVADLVKQLDGRKIKRPDGTEVTLALARETVVQVPMTRFESLAAKLLHPQIVALLMLAGIVGLGFELTHPGAILPGVVGAISLLISLWGLAILPINVVGVALLLLAVAFFIAEFKITSHGLLGIGGAIALVIGAAMLIDAPIPEMRIDWITFFPTAILIAGSFAFMATRAARLRLSPPVTGAEGLIGVIGEARTPLDPTGKVFVEGTYWDAESTAPVPEGGKVEVVEVRGLTLRVRPSAGPGSSPETGGMR